MSLLELFAQNLLSPALLFFALGMFSGFIKSDLNIPDQISRFLAIYLMMAIGFKGGVAIAQTSDIDGQVIATILTGIGFGFFQPFIAYVLLRITSKLDNTTAAAVAAHYGSISMVTFVTAASFLDAHNVIYAGYIVAVLALMEAPAILSGLVLAHRGGSQQEDHSDAMPHSVWHEVSTNGAILLLIGAFIIGWVTGTPGMDKMHGFLVTPFQGILALFLLDMGLLVTRQIQHLKEFSISLILFGIYMPLIGGALGLGLSYLIGLDMGTGMLFIVLCASASYIAVPAAMRMALPKAKAAIYVPMSLAITFPFNIALGIPLYYAAAKFFLV